jgi:hypothetical protein
MGASIALALCDGSRKAIMYGTGSSSPTRPPQLPPATGHVRSACPKRIALGRLRRYRANDCLHQDKSIPLRAVQHRAISHGSICASRATAIDRLDPKLPVDAGDVESPGGLSPPGAPHSWTGISRSGCADVTQPVAAREVALRRNPHFWVAKRTKPQMIPCSVRDFEL